MLQPYLGTHRSRPSISALGLGAISDLGDCDLGEHPIEPVDAPPVEAADAELEAVVPPTSVHAVEAAVADVVADDRPP